MDYSCTIDGDLLVCKITPDRPLSGAVLCFSGMAPMAPVDGGTLRSSLGSFTEVALPDLAAKDPHVVRIRYTGGYTPANRAWMPMGPYLRLQDQIIPLPPSPAGRRPMTYTPSKRIDGLPIVPHPSQWMPTGETTGVIDGFKTSGDAMAAVAALAQRQNLSFEGSLPVTLLAEDMPEEAYRVEIAPGGITIAASSRGGQFYAGITLLTLLQHGPLPCGIIKDEPRFGWRGQHLDTARHYYELSSILSLLDLMALLKLNRFHWHFADDEAFRLELESLPELAQKTALRGEGQMLPALFAGTPCEGGTYSKSMAHAIIDHAAILNIDVMPEIETPAHALALTTLYPETRDPGDNGSEVSVQGYERNALNPAMPKTWDLLERIITEISDLFPFEYLHLGCDELPKETWMSSPKARALMEAHGLSTTQDLQGWTIEKIGAFTAATGKRPAAWEEAAQGSNSGINNRALLFSWTGQEAGLEAARKGYDVVMTPAQNVYLDMAHTDAMDDWGANWAGYVDLADTISWDPVPDPKLAGKILGVQGAFWSEFTTEDQQIWPMLMPRMLGIAMMAWQETPPEAQMLFAHSAHYHVDELGQIAIRS